jgi:hypothetical protein
MKEGNMKENSFEKSVADTYSNPNQVPIPSSLGTVKPFPDPMQVKQRITGVSPGPMPSKKPPSSSYTQQDFDAKVAALRDYSKSLTNANEDNNEWAKVYSYNSGPSGAYYERYKQFTVPGKLDFHPMKIQILQVIYIDQYHKLFYPCFGMVLKVLCLAQLEFLIREIF